MDVPMVIRGIRDHARTVPGLTSAHYPAPNGLQASDLPALVLFWGAPEGETRILHDGTPQTWLPMIMGQLLAARLGDTPAEFAKVDELITPIVDSFTPDPDPNALAFQLPGVTGYVDRCLIDRGRSGIGIRYAGHDYYGAELFFNVKFHRYRGQGYE